MRGYFWGAAIAFAALLTGGAQAQSLSTGFAGGNGCSGNMFDVTTTSNPLTVQSIELHIDSTSLVDAYIYTRPGTYDGFSTNSAGWTLVDSGPLTGAGSGTGTLWDINDFILPGSATTALFVGLDTNNIDYSNQTAGTLLTSDANLSIFAGVGKCADPDPFAASDNNGRAWNGTINYTVGADTGVVPLPAGAPLLLGGLVLIASVQRRRS